MQLIEIGDLSLSSTYSTRNRALFEAIRQKVISGLWTPKGKLPSTRLLASNLNLSRNTVISAYEQLVDEGYIESRPSVGFFVTSELPDDFISCRASITCSARTDKNMSATHNRYRPGVPDIEHFPYEKWQRLLQLHGARTCLSGVCDIQGNYELRFALSQYLASSRSVACNPNNIIITSGSQQSFLIALIVLNLAGKKVLMETPGYRHMNELLSVFQCQVVDMPVMKTSGLELSKIDWVAAKAMYVSPSNQFPLGVSLGRDERIALLQQAERNQTCIIEDDYDSEFQFGQRPNSSLQGLVEEVAPNAQVFYVGTLSKVMFNSVRLGYMVVPESWVDACNRVKSAVSGPTMELSQAALADFISQGDLVRHIRKMRQLYKERYLLLCQQIKKHFDGKLTVVSQAAGIHLLVTWTGRLSEQEFVNTAKKLGMMLNALSDYESVSYENRDYHGVLIGFGCIKIEDIESDIKRLANRLVERI